MLKKWLKQQIALSVNLQILLKNALYLRHFNMQITRQLELNQHLEHVTSRVSIGQLRTSIVVFIVPLSITQWRSVKQRLLLMESAITAGFKKMTKAKSILFTQELNQFTKQFVAQWLLLVFQQNLRLLSLYNLEHRLRCLLHL